MHILAYYYHWDRNSLWDIPVTERQKWVSLLYDQLKAEKDALEK